MKRILLTIGVLTLSAAGLMAQSSWKNVQTLPKDQRIVVETRDGKVLKGRFQSGDDEKMSLLKSGKQVSIDKDDVKKVYVGKKQRSILGGVIGGLGGMFLLGGTVAAANRESDPGSYGGMAAGAVGLFGGSILGGKVGARIRRSWLVYQAP
jgi:hypothetical protein